MTSNSPHIQSIWTFYALQLARIHTQLYPHYTNPVHVRGPRRPDMAEQEQLMQPDFFDIEDLPEDPQ